MRTLAVAGKETTSSIHVGADIRRLAQFLPAGRTVIVTDERVSGLYSSCFPTEEVITVGQGEVNKTLEAAASVYEALVCLEADRSVFLLAVGGGIVCDLTGLVASTYLRGVRFGYCPTTLLAQVDASVGGKTGVNFRGYKNMVGVFSQPEFVLCDPVVLQSLPQEEVASGFAEVIKHAAIADASYFEFLEREKERALNLESRAMERIVYDSVAIKAGVVNRDEKEKGERRKLNFGHTFGHAIEKVKGLRHGEAVSIGMTLAARLSVRRGMLSPESGRRLENLLQEFRLPVSTDVDKALLLDALLRDKKREGGIIRFVLLESLGQAVVVPIAIGEIEDIL
jgi:3-dehydroquinate synthase